MLGNTIDMHYIPILETESRNELQEEDYTDFENRFGFENEHFSNCVEYFINTIIARVHAILMRQKEDTAFHLSPTIEKFASDIISTFGYIAGSYSARAIPETVDSFGIVKMSKHQRKAIKGLGPRWQKYTESVRKCAGKSVNLQMTLHVIHCNNQAKHELVSLGKTRSQEQIIQILRSLAYKILFACGYQNLKYAGVS